MRRLHELLHLTRTLPLPVAADRILEETGWLALASTQPAGAAAGRLLQVVDRVRAVAEEGGGLRDAAEALEEDEASNEAEALPLEPGRQDVVRLMNLHKAKGLEAPVVVLADATHDYRFPLAVRIVRKDGTARGFLRVVNRQKQGFSTAVVGEPRDWEEHEQEEQKYVDAERLRLLYVAGTRAEELLIVCRSAKAAANKAWREFAGFLAGVPEVEVARVEVRAGNRPAGAGVSAEARAAAAEARAATQARLRGASWAARSVTGGEDAAANRLAGAASAATSPVPSQGPGGTAWGSVMHGLLEHAVRHEAATRADLERLACWLTVETPELRRFVGEALDTVEALRRAPFWEDPCGANAVHVEIPFAVFLEAGQSLAPGQPAAVPTVVHGVIDLAYRRQDGWRILDYKTDRLPSYDPSCDPIVFDRHGTQLTEYRAAWERVTGEVVSGQGIVLVRGNRTAWAEVPPSLAGP
jgi:ATP-dependent helicase/nuclease subunit A